MQSGRLTAQDSNATFEADLAIVGAGPVGLSIAHSCARAGLQVLVLESGLERETAEHEVLNEVELPGDEADNRRADRRAAFHGPQAPHWDPSRQRYGVRCRGLGGSTQAWAGKSAPFDSIDFERRDWVPHSGWPIALDDLTPFLTKAGELLGLAPAAPERRFEEAGLQSFYWQFARSKVDRLDIMRFGRDFAPGLPGNVRLLCDATVTRIDLGTDGRAVDHLRIASLSGARAMVRAKRFVLAASAIENARLLLVSNSVEPAGIGNRHDNVGRYLTDHAGVRLGAAQGAQVASLARRFGFRGLAHKGRSHMFMHGLALAPALQREGETLNAAIYFAPERAPDDPWDALKRLLRRRSDRPANDIASTVRGSGLLARGLAVRALNSRRMPAWASERIVNAAVRLAPNAAAEEFQSAGLPHKLTGLGIEAVTETAPSRDNRIALSAKVDAFGIRLPLAHWRVGELETRTLKLLGSRLVSAFEKQGLAPPVLDEWLSTDGIAPPVVDLAHTMGTTRMSRTPETGVVDSNCRVHGIANLFAAGGSVFPTAGHANPTWMFIALALRLADHIAAESRAGQAEFEGM